MTVAHANPFDIASGPGTPRSRQWIRSLRSHRVICSKLDELVEQIDGPRIDPPVALRGPTEAQVLAEVERLASWGFYSWEIVLLFQRDDEAVRAAFQRGHRTLAGCR